MNTTNNISKPYYPDFPESISEGDGAIIGDIAYVGLGKAEDRLYALNLKKPTQWKKLPNCIGGKRSQPVIEAVADKLYVFGGLAENSAGITEILTDVFVYDTTSQIWEKIPTYIPFAVVGARSFVYDDTIYFVGGVNSNIFNGVFKDLYNAGSDKEKTKILQRYLDKPAEEYFFNQQLISYNPATNSWKNEGVLPLGRAGASIAMSTTDDGVNVIVANGEIKPGLRTDSVVIGTLRDRKWRWKELPNLISHDGITQQEGLAGGYSGIINNNYIVTGGASFAGARQQYANGMKHAHKGLQKAFHDTVFLLDNNQQWHVVGKLPQPMGYGVSLAYKNTLLVIGGNNNNGEVATVYQLSLDNGALVVN